MRWEVEVCSENFIRTGRLTSSHFLSNRPGITSKDAFALIMKRSIENLDCHEASKQQKVHHGAEHHVVRLYEIPQYLRSSYFYQSLCIDDAGEISIPAKHLKRDLSLSSMSDLVELLNTFRFWMLETILPELVFFLLFTVDVDCTDILAEFSTELKYLSVYTCILESKRESMVLTRTMLKNGWTVSTESLKRAVLNNITHIVRYALNVMLSSMGMECRLVRFRDYRHRRVVEFLTDPHKLYGAPPDDYSSIESRRSANDGFDWCHFALKQGIMSCLALFHERCHNCTWQKDKYACMLAIQKGHLACAQYCMQHGCDFNLVDCALLVANPRLGLLPPDHAETVTAKQNECLQFLRERCERQNIAHDVTTTALKQGNVVAQRKLIEQGWPSKPRATTIFSRCKSSALQVMLCLLPSAASQRSAVTWRYCSSRTSRAVHGMQRYALWLRRMTT